MGEALAMNTANFRLIGVIIGWSKPFAGDSAFGNGLKTSFWGIDLDSGFLDELISPIGFEKILESFFFGEEDRLFEFAAIKGRLLFRNFKMSTAAGTLSEDDLRDIE